LLEGFARDHWWQAVVFDPLAWYLTRQELHAWLKATDREGIV
jgi:hypothetical protein